MNSTIHVASYDWKFFFIVYALSSHVFEIHFCRCFREDRTFDDRDPERMNHVVYSLTARYTLYGPAIDGTSSHILAHHFFNLLRVLLNLTGPVILSTKVDVLASSTSMEQGGWAGSSFLMYVPTCDMPVIMPSFPSLLKCRSLPPRRELHKLFSIFLPDTVSQ